MEDKSMNSKRANDKLKEVVKNDRGSALITALVLLLVFAVIGASALVLSMNNFYVAQRMSEYEDSYYIAEANAQYALTFIKEEITEYYMQLYNIPPTNPWEYDVALAAFYPTLVDSVCTAEEYESTCEFTPLDYSDQGVQITVNISVDPATPIPTYSYGQPGNEVRFLIECIAESDTSRRVVNAVITVDDPDIDWDMTSAPPMTDMRMLVGNEIVLTDDLQNNEYNAIFCRGSALIAYAFVPQFLENHEEFLNTYTYEFSNAVPTILTWDVQYDKFPQHDAFDTFDTLFEASSSSTDLYDSFYDWRNRTINYNISNYAPNTYPNSEIIDSATSPSDVDYHLNYNAAGDDDYFRGTSTDYVRLYSTGSLTITGTGDIRYSYIYCEGNITIDIEGSIEDCIIISNGGSINIDCESIVNAEHMLIKAKRAVNIVLDTGNSGGLMQKVIVRSTGNRISLNYDTTSLSYDKIVVNSCYFHTNKNDKDAMIYLRNAYLNDSFVSAGKDLVLRNCSGQNTAFYAFGTTDSNISNDGTSKLFSPDDYCDYMQYGDNSYLYRYYRGIIVISELSATSENVDHRFYQDENVFLNCDFTTDESIFLCDPNWDYHNMAYDNYYGHYEDTDSYLAKLIDCRILADREVLLEDIIMDGCYVYAGIRGYEDEQEYWTYYSWWQREYVNVLYKVRGIYIRADDIHNEITDCVFYSRGRMMYSQHTPERNGYTLTEEGKVRVYSSFFYSINRFDYNGTSTSEGLDTTIMRNNSDLCNNMIIMTESHLGPHEYAPSIANDIIFIGGDMGLDPERPHYSQTLYDLMGGETQRGIDNSIDVQTEHLYDNYFEQMLELDEIQREVPGFNDVFVFEDIYEIKEADGDN